MRLRRQLVEQGIGRPATADENSAPGQSARADQTIDNEGQQRTLAAERREAAEIPGEHENARIDRIELEEENECQRAAINDRHGAGETRAVGREFPESADPVKLRTLNRENRKGADERHGDQILRAIALAVREIDEVHREADGGDQQKFRKAHEAFEDDARDRRDIGAALHRARGAGKRFRSHVGIRPPCARRVARILLLQIGERDFFHPVRKLTKKE